MHFTEKIDILCWTVSSLIVLLELLAVLLDYIDHFQFDKQAFVAWHKISAYYASIMLNASGTYYAQNIMPS